MAAEAVEASTEPRPAMAEPVVTSVESFPAVISKASSTGTLQPFSTQHQVARHISSQGKDGADGSKGPDGAPGSAHGGKGKRGENGTPNNQSGKNGENVQSWRGGNGTNGGDGTKGGNGSDAQAMSLIVSGTVDNLVRRPSFSSNCCFCCPDLFGGVGSAHACVNQSFNASARPRFSFRRDALLAVVCLTARDAL